MISLEEIKVVEDDKKEEDMSDNNSTNCPSSDKQSEPSLNGDADLTSTATMTPVLQVEPK